VRPVTAGIGDIVSYLASTDMYDACCLAIDAYNRMQVHIDCENMNRSQDMPSC